MLGIGIGVVVAFLTSAVILVLTGAIYVGRRLGIGKPTPFDKLGTGDYVLWYLGSADWNPVCGTAWILISRLGKKSVSYVTLPIRCLRGYGNEPLMNSEAVRAILGTGFALAEIVEKKGEHLLRFQSPVSAAASATEAELDAVASLAGFASATAEPSRSIADQPTLILDTSLAPPEERPAGPNGHGEPETPPPPSTAQVGSL